MKIKTRPALSFRLCNKISKIFKRQRNAMWDMLCVILLCMIFFFLLRKWCRGPIISTFIKKRLDGNVVVITGASSGIGKETARDLAHRGAKVIILCRNMDKGKQACIEIQNGNWNLDISTLFCDLSSLKSVKNCAKQLLETQNKIDILINNAGIMACGPIKTEDNIDLQFSSNHLGHFFLTHLLTPKLGQSLEDSKVIIVTSFAHKYGKINWADINYHRSGYDSMKAYGQSKLANVMFARELAERLKDLRVSVYAVNPGVVTTALSRHSLFFEIMFFILRPILKTPLHGAQTTLYCILSDSVQTGKYYSDCREAIPHSNAINREEQIRLWTLSEEMIGETLLKYP